MVDVKILIKKWRLNYKFQQPLIAGNNELRRFLHHFSGWLSIWADIKDPSGKLPKETFSALMHTKHALLKIPDCCVNEPRANIKFVLLGKFHTDSLKSRFGSNRQLAGGKYDVSLRQAYECEKKFIYCQR